MPDTISVFRNPNGEKLYMAAYEESLKLWPIPYESTTIPTKIGETHVIISGLKDAKPLVMLHGASASSTMWFANVGELGAKYRIYAIDTVSDVGKSKITSLPKDRKELADWLVEVFNGLDIQNPHLVGLSYGGFLTINMASFFPELIDRIVMLAPAGVFDKLTLMFYFKAFSTMFFPFKGRLDSFMKWIVADGFKINEIFEKQMKLAMGKGKSRIKVYPSLFPDEELRGIDKPALLFVGDQEVIYNAERVIERAKRLMPNVETELIPDCGHVIAIEKPDFVNKRILSFLSEG